MREEVEKGHQVYVVCPRIAGDDAEADQDEIVDLDEDGNPVAAAARSLRRGRGGRPAARRRARSTGLRVARLHGKLPADEKDATMRAFARHEIDVLVSTTVIEVGVDVANATMMVILDADRFGVSQLHQLRGRVGRGGLPGLCLLVTHAEDPTSPARRAPRRGRRHHRRLRAEPDRPGAAARGRRARRVPGRSAVRASRTCGSCATRTPSSRPGRPPRALLERDPALDDAPLLADAVADLERSQQGDFVEKS